MAVDLKEVMEKAEAEQEAAGVIFNLAFNIDKAKTGDGTSLHPDTLTAMRSKIPAAKTALITARTELDTAITP